MTTEKQEKIQEKIINELMAKAVKHILEMDKDHRDIYIDLVIFYKMGLVTGDIDKEEFLQLNEMGWDLNDLSIDYAEKIIFNGGAKFVFKTPTGLRVTLFLWVPERTKLTKSQWEEYMFYKTLCSS